MELISKEIIIETTKAVLGLITDLEDHEDPYVNRTIEELDINAKITIIESLIDINKTIQIRDTTVNTCIRNIHNIIDKIKVEMELIKKLLPLHKDKWFHAWRTPEYYKNLENVKRFTHILSARFKLYLDIKSLCI